MMGNYIPNTAFFTVKAFPFSLLLSLADIWLTFIGFNFYSGRVVSICCEAYFCAATLSPKKRHPTRIH